MPLATTSGLVHLLDASGVKDTNEPMLHLSACVQRVLVTLGLLTRTLFLWRVVDVLLLIFGATLFAILLRALADALGRYTPLRNKVAAAGAVAGQCAASVLAEPRRHGGDE
jgi:hypothetical protein